MNFSFMDFFFKFGIVFKKNRGFWFLGVIFRLSYQTNILMNFLVSSMYTKRNYWGLKSIEYIFLFLFQHNRKCKIHLFCFFTFIYFLYKQSLNRNSNLFNRTFSLWSPLSNETDCTNRLENDEVDLI